MKSIQNKALSQYRIWATQKLILYVLISASSILAGCTSPIAFEEILSSCTPPKSSARYGKSIGPIINSPVEKFPFNSSVVVSGTCADGYPLVLHGSGLTTAVNGNCVSGAFSETVSFKSGDGVKQLDVSQPTFQKQDITDRRCFLKDTTPPKVSISGSSGAQAVSTTNIHLEGKCENGLDVLISGPQLTSSVTTSCNRGSFSATVTFTGTDGLKDVVATQLDLAGNNGNDTKEYLTDTTAPLVQILSPTALSSTQGNLLLTGLCEVGPPIIITGDTTGITTAVCTAGTFSTTVELSNGDGSKNIAVSQTDIAGNTGSDQRGFIKDITPPTLAITLPLANTVAQTGLTVSGTCESGLTVNLSGAGLSAASTATCTAGAFSAAITFSAVDGTKNIIASQTDSVGNTSSDNRNFVKDTSAPAIAITSPAANTVAQTGLTVSGTCESGLTVNLSGAGISAASTATCTAGAFSAAITFSAV
ncbi:MAG: hypothetical protein ABL927_09815, partial [Bdellovibrionales bacterium]